LFWNHNALTNKFTLFLGTKLKKTEKPCKVQAIKRTWKLMLYCKKRKSSSFLFNSGRLPPLPTFIPHPSYKQTRVSEFLGSHVYQSSWVHTCIKVPGFSRVSEFLGSHMYQSSRVLTCIRVPGFTRVSEFLGSHVYQSSWVHTCIRVPGFTRASEFPGTHVYQSSWVHTCIRVPEFSRVSEFLGSYVYQSSWVHTWTEFVGSDVYQSSWFHTCIRVPGFKRVSEFLGSHVYQSSWVYFLSKLLGSHVYQSSWLHKRLSDFRRSHRFGTNVLKLVHIPVKYPLKPLHPSVRPSVRLAECNNSRIFMEFNNGKFYEKLSSYDSFG